MRLIQKIYHIKVLIKLFQKFAVSKGRAGDGEA